MIKISGNIQKIASDLNPKHLDSLICRHLQMIRQPGGLTPARRLVSQKAISTIHKDSTISKYRHETAENIYQRGYFPYTLFHHNTREVIPSIQGSYSLEKNKEYPGYTLHVMKKLRGEGALCNPDLNMIESSIPFSSLQHPSHNK